MSDDICENKGKKYKHVSPDGGHGYVIWICMTLIYSIGSCFVASFGLIYKDFIEASHIRSTELNIINGISCISLSFGGFIVGPLLSIISRRKVALLAAVLFNLGTLSQIFMFSVSFLSFVQALQRFSYGILYNLAGTLLSDYFVTKRFLTISVTKSLAAALAMTAPIFVKWSLEVYGFRGTLLLIAGISLHLFIGISLIHPVKLHLRKVPLEDEKEVTKLLVEEKVKKNEAEVTSSINKISNLENNRLPEKETKSDGVDTQETTPLKKLRNNFKEMTKLKSYFFSSACLGVAIAVSVENSYILMLPLALFELGWNQKNVSFALSLLSFGDLLTKILFVFINQWLRKLGSHKVCIVGFLISFLTKLGVQSTDNEIAVLTYIALMGIGRCALYVLIPLVTADAVDSQKFPAAMGLQMLTYGVFSLGFGAVIGAIRDMTNSYPTVFYILSSCYGIVALFWCIEICYKSNRYKWQKSKINKMTK